MESSNNNTSTVLWLNLSLQLIILIQSAIKYYNNNKNNTNHKLNITDLKHMISGLDIKLSNSVDSNKEIKVDIQ